MQRQEEVVGSQEKEGKMSNRIREDEWSPGREGKDQIEREEP